MNNTYEKASMGSEHNILRMNIGMSNSSAMHILRLYNLRKLKKKKKIQRNWKP